MIAPLLEIAERQVADTSLQAFARVRETLTKREIVVYRELHWYLADTGYSDVTGGELTLTCVRNKTARDVNGVRPRLTGLHDKGWLVKLPSRTCRAYGTSAHPYAPVVPLSALHDLNPNDGGR